MQIAQRHHQVASDRATKTTIPQFEYVLGEVGDDQMINTDFAKLVDNDDGV